MKSFLHVGLFCAIVVGCGGPSLDERRFDNPEARRLQKESVASVSATPIDGQGISEFFRDRVGLIANPKKRIPTGRAVPLTPDGYFLTAWHVVSDGKFVLSDEVLLKALPKTGPFRTADYLRTDQYDGRVVWKDVETDLAILKFDYRPKAPFSLRGSPAAEGSQVFSGASGSNSGTVVFSSSSAANSAGESPETSSLESALASATGNGPFETAGVITRSKVSPTPPGRMSFDSTLVGRGGMSGAPVVDEDGRLVGIVTSLRGSALTGETRTRLTLISPEELRAIIEADRRKSF